MAKREKSGVILLVFSSIGLILHVYQLQDAYLKEPWNRRVSWCLLVITVFLFIAVVYLWPRFRRYRSYKLLFAMLAGLPIPGFCLWRYLKPSQWPSERIVVAVADFDSFQTEDDKLGIGRCIGQQLGTYFRHNPHIMVDRIPFKTNNFGLAESDAAALRNRGVDMLVWGWYGGNDHTGLIPVSIHFEPLGTICAELDFGNMLSGQVQHVALGAMSITASQGLTQQLRCASAITAGVILYETGEVAEAQRSLTEALSLYCATESSEIKATAHFSRAKCFRKLGQIDTAASDYEKAIEYEPHTLPARNNLAVLRATQGDAQSAVALLEAAVQDVANDGGNIGNSWWHVNIYNNLALLYAPSGNVKEAGRLFEQAIDVLARHQVVGSLDPCSMSTTADIHFNFANHLHRYGGPSDAQVIASQYNNALRIYSSAPRSDKTVTRAALIYLELGILAENSGYVRFAMRSYDDGLRCLSAGETTAMECVRARIVSRRAGLRTGRERQLARQELAGACTDLKRCNASSPSMISFSDVAECELALASFLDNHDEANQVIVEVLTRLEEHYKDDAPKERPSIMLDAKLRYAKHLTSLDRLEEARGLLDDIIRTMEEAERTLPGILMEVLTVRSTISEKEGRIEDACKDAAEAHSVFSKLPPDMRKSLHMRYRGSLLQYNVAQCDAKIRGFTYAKEELVDAIAQLEAIVRESGDYENSLFEVLADYCRTLIEAKRCEDAKGVFERAREVAGALSKSNRFRHDDILGNLKLKYQACEAP